MTDTPIEQTQPARPVELDTAVVGALAAHIRDALRTRTAAIGGDNTGRLGLTEHDLATIALAFIAEQNTGIAQALKLTDGAYLRLDAMRTERDQARDAASRLNAKAMEQCGRAVLAEMSLARLREGIEGLAAEWCHKGEDAAVQEECEALARGAVRLRALLAEGW